MDIIVDLDGTLTDATHRLHYIKGPGKKDWPAFFAACEADPPNEPIVAMVRALNVEGNRLIFCSGRPEKCRGATLRWIERHLGIPPNPPLYMREDGDFRADDVVKREKLRTIRSLYNPTLAIDDRKRVVDMWRAEGIVCAQVADGEF